MLGISGIVILTILCQVIQKSTPEKKFSENLDQCSENVGWVCKKGFAYLSLVTDTATMDL